MTRTGRRINLIVLGLLMGGLAGSRHADAQDREPSALEYARLFTARVDGGGEADLAELTRLARQEGTIEIIRFDTEQGPETPARMDITHLGSPAHAYPGFSIGVRKATDEAIANGILKSDIDGRGLTPISPNTSGITEFRMPQKVGEPIWAVVEIDEDTRMRIQLFEEPLGSGGSPWPVLLRIDVPGKGSIVRIYEYLGKDFEYSPAALQASGASAEAEESEGSGPQMPSLRGTDTDSVGFSCSRGRSYSWDTCYRPGGSCTPGGYPVQLRFGFFAGAELEADVSGQFSLNDQSRNLCVGPGSGTMCTDVGAQLIAEACIDVYIIDPMCFDIPYVPNIDLRAQCCKSFNSFLLDSTAYCSDEITRQRLWCFDLVPVPLLTAGFCADVSASLDASMTCDSMTTSDGKSFTSEGQCRSVTLSGCEYHKSISYNENFTLCEAIHLYPTLSICADIWPYPCWNWSPYTFDWTVYCGQIDLSCNSSSLDFVFPESISTPSTPSGDGDLCAGDTAQYCTGNASSSCGHSVEYRFDWDDGNQSAWGSSCGSHSWSGAGTYCVQAQARCKTHTSVKSDWSACRYVTVHAESISIPSTPSGDASLCIDAGGNYSTGNAQSSCGHQVEYQFDWGDGSQSGWGSSSGSHAWTSPGSYCVKARARCKTHTSIVSGWSACRSVTVQEESISTPSVPSGDATLCFGETGTYSTGSAQSSCGHQVEYQFDWGDGSQSGWGSPSRSYSWSVPGTYCVKARARCSTHTSAMSDWSSCRDVTVRSGTVTTPQAPTGSTDVCAGDCEEYCTAGSMCDCGHPVEYVFDWGNGELSTWGQPCRSRCWPTPGGYCVRAKARCTVEDVESGWSSCLQVNVQAESISAPDSPSGPDRLCPNVEGCYSAGSAASSCGHAVEYRFDWGDGERSPWGQSPQCHTWMLAGTYTIKAQARCSVHPSVVSTWSAGQSIVVDVDPGPCISVAGGSFSASGCQGGPFTPCGSSFTITNVACAPGQMVSWRVDLQCGWITATPSAGILASGQQQAVEVQLNGEADSLSPGTYTCTVVFSSDAACGDTTRTVSLQVGQSACLAVLPETGLEVSGCVEGPFNPSTASYTITNSGSRLCPPLEWTVELDDDPSCDWLTLTTPDQGELEGGESAAVALAVDDLATDLSAGTYTCRVSFTNDTDGCGNDDRTIVLVIDDTDSDGDQVPDCRDSCPSDRNKVDPGICGCNNPDTDADRDTWAQCDDCNDRDPSIHPNAEEVCGDGVDNNCNGRADELCLQLMVIGGDGEPRFWYYSRGDLATVNAPPHPAGWPFDHWEGDVPPGRERDDPLALIMDSDKAITALYRGPCQAELCGFCILQGVVPAMLGLCCAKLIRRRRCRSK